MLLLERLLQVDVVLGGFEMCHAGWSDTCSAGSKHVLRMSVLQPYTCSNPSLNRSVWDMYSMFRPEAHETVGRAVCA